MDNTRYNANRQPMTPLAKTEQRRQTIVAAAAQHLIQNGMQNSGLRAIAKSAGMSDRMVMYYFETKEELVSEALLMIGQSLSEGTKAALPPGKNSAKQVLDALLEAMHNPEGELVMRLWFEIVGLAMRDQQPYKQTAATLLEGWEDQIREALRTDQKHRAREVLAALEGRLMVHLLSGSDAT